MTRKSKSKNILLKQILKDIESPLGFSNNFTIVIIGLLMLVIGLGAGYIFFGKNDSSINQASQVNEAPPVVVSSVPPSSTTQPSSNLKTYSSSLYGFTLKYPESWKVREDDSFDGTVFFTSGDTSLLTFYGTPPGRGCGPGDESKNKTASLNFGKQVMNLQNFCGTNLYILTARNKDNKILTIDINFIDTTFESAGRAALESIEGLSGFSK